MEPTTLMCPADMVQFLKDQGHSFDGPHAWVLMGPRNKNDAGTSGVVITECLEIDLDAPEGFSEIMRTHADSVAVFIHTHNTVQEDGDGYDRVVPCEHDVQMTVYLAGVCIMTKVHLMDHCLIGCDGDVYSLAANGILKLCLMVAVSQIPPFLLGGSRSIDMLTFAPDSESEKMRQAESFLHPPVPPAENKLPSVMLDAINEARARQGKPPLQM